jgi:hypothetical protein
VTQSLSTPHSDLIAKLYAERLRPAGDQSRTDGKPPYWHDNSTSDLLLHAAIALSETGTVEPEHLQDAPRVAREKFKVPNPFPHDPKKPEQSEISVVFSSFAACIERETNTLRSLTPSATGDYERRYRWLLHNGGLLNEWAAEWNGPDAGPLIPYLEARIEAALRNSTESTVKEKS